MFYAIAVNSLQIEMEKKELKETADYVSNTISSLFFLQNATIFSNATIEKELIYLPSAIENSIYILKIDGIGGNASKVTAYLKNNISVSSYSWLSPGLRIASENSVQSGGRVVVAGCNRTGLDFFVWIRYKL